MKIQRILVIAPAAPGSKGDEGMMRGVLDIFDNIPIAILGIQTDTLNESNWVGELADPRVSFLHVSKFNSNLDNLFQPGDLLMVVGADVIDGTCGIQPAMIRLVAIEAATERAIPVYVTCSFRSDVDSKILQQINKLTEVNFLLRDSISLKNFEEQVGRKGSAFNDLAFFYKNENPSSLAIQLMNETESLKGPRIALNFAEHSFRSFSDNHSDEARREFVATVIDTLLEACPDASFVLLSNDSREFENHPSDDFYNDIAELYILQKIGQQRVFKAPGQMSYADNIFALESSSLLVTGRMHLALASVRAATQPIILMGTDKKYTSIDKMRGAFTLHFGSDRQVVSNIKELFTVAKEVYQQDDSALKDYGQKLKSCCSKDLETLLKKIDEDMTMLLPHQLRLQQLTADLAQAQQDMLELREQYNTVSLAHKYDLTAQKNEAQEEIEAQKRWAHEQISEYRASIEQLGQAGQAMATQLQKDQRRPWRPLKRQLRYALANLISLFAPLLSDKRQKKLVQSAEKRNSSRHLQTWGRMVAEARGAHYDETPFFPFAKKLPYKLLRNLSKATKKIAPRHAARFANSAEKRNPARIWRQENQVTAQAGLYVDPEVEHNRYKKILVSDYRLPRFDVSAGERATVGLIEDLCAIGYEVTFLPKDLEDVSPYRQELEKFGVEVITKEQGYYHPADYISSNGHKFGTYYLIRIDVVEAISNAIKKVAPSATLIFHAPDLYFLRERRAAELSGNSKEIAKAAETKRREIAVMQAADHVVLVSPAELPHLIDVIDQDKISIFPALYSPVIANPIGFDQRKNFFFLGGFAHAPNVASVKWFVANVWPLIHAALPDAEFHIIGAEAPADVIELGNISGVQFIGYVSDLNPILQQFRVNTAPLLFGAGIKGKVSMTMGAGVPNVMTTIAAEGMGIINGVHGLVRDEANTFADACIELYTHDTMWSDISKAGLKLVDDNFGANANRSSVLSLLDKAGSLAPQLYSAFCETLPAKGFKSETDIEVSVIVPVFNQWSLTRNCLASLQVALKDIRAEVILADDGSTDETMRASEIFPGLHIHRSAKNLGFLLNCNAAAQYAKGDYVLLLNNDTVVLPNAITEMLRLHKCEPKAAIVGSKLFYPDGTIQEMGAALYNDGTAQCIGRGLSPSHELLHFDREVDYCTGAAILVSKDFWDANGGFDDRYAPAYCEDSDLAMSARARGMQVWCAANARVVHFEHGSYGEQVEMQPKLRALKNLSILREKWKDVLEKDHLPSLAEHWVVAAHAERHPKFKDRLRRSSGKMNILYFSPFPSHPDNHGNQATIQAFGRRMKAMGHSVHFALLKSNMYDAEQIVKMQAAWDTFDIVPNNHTLSANGNDIEFDEWYENGQGEHIRMLCEKYHIDVVFCSYVFQSKLLEFVPAHVLKVIDTHDKMGGRYDMLREKKLPIEFFSCTPDEEGRYLRRADCVGARREEEAIYFDGVVGRKTSVVLSHIEEERFLNRKYGNLKEIGLVASANRINLEIVINFLKAMKSHFGEHCPYNVTIAGQVRDMISMLPQEDRNLFQSSWIRMLGFVPDISSFYKSVDLVVSPVTMGTGINVKTVQAMAFGMPILATKTAIKGIETNERFHSFETQSDLVANLDKISSSELNRLAEVSRNRYGQFIADSDAHFAQLFGHPKLSQEL